MPSWSARALRFTISTGTVDREQDRIALAGWDLGELPAQPGGAVGRTMPAGCRSAARSTCAIEGAALKASVEFIPYDTPEAGQFAEAVYRLARGGFIAATSVGFRPIKWEYTQRPGARRRRLVPRHRFRATGAGRAVDRHRAGQPRGADRCAGARRGRRAIAAATPRPMTGEEITALRRSNSTERAAGASAPTRTWQRRQLRSATRRNGGQVNAHFPRSTAN